MDSNARKQLKVITDFFSRQKDSLKEKSVITKNEITTSKSKPNEKSGLYIEKETLIDLIRALTHNELRVSESNSSQISIVIPKK